MYPNLKNHGIKDFFHKKNRNSKKKKSAPKEKILLGGDVFKQGRVREQKKYCP